MTWPCSLLIGAESSAAPAQKEQQSPAARSQPTHQLGAEKRPGHSHIANIFKACFLSIFGYKCGCWAHCRLTEAAHIFHCPELSRWNLKLLRGMMTTHTQQEQVYYSINGNSQTNSCQHWQSLLTSFTYSPFKCITCILSTQQQIIFLISATCSALTVPFPSICPEEQRQNHHRSTENKGQWFTTSSPAIAHKQIRGAAGYRSFG